MDYAMPSRCPVCSGSLEITKLTCPKCRTEIGGKFAPCKFCTLDEKMKTFLDAFLKSRGNIREVEKTLSISYPTVRGLLEELLRQLYPEEPAREDEKVPSEKIFDMLERKQITADEAAALLSGRRIDFFDEKGSEEHE
jgi:hypothetical protein